MSRHAGLDLEYETFSQRLAAQPGRSRVRGPQHRNATPPLRTEAGAMRTSDPATSSSLHLASYPSPLVTHASPAASAEQVRSPVNIALHERAHPVPKIEVQREDALSAHQALIGLHQQIVPLNAFTGTKPPWTTTSL